MLNKIQAIKDDFKEHGIEVPSKILMPMIFAFGPLSYIGLLYIERPVLLTFIGLAVSINVPLYCDYRSVKRRACEKNLKNKISALRFYYIGTSVFAIILLLGAAGIMYLGLKNSTPLY